MESAMSCAGFVVNLEETVTFSNPTKKKFELFAALLAEGAEIGRLTVHASKKMPVTTALSRLCGQIFNTSVTATRMKLEIASLPYKKFADKVPLMRNDYISAVTLFENLMVPEDAEGLARALAGNRSLLELHISENRLGDEGAEAISSALLGSGHPLTSLHLDQNNIGPRGAKAMGTALLRNDVLEKLAIIRNRIGDSGIESISAALLRNRSLSSLVLEDNEIADTGAIALGKALTCNQGLQHLSLCHNWIADSGAVGLAKALYQNHALEMLDCDGNQIRDDGAKALADAIRHNMPLRVLRLEENKISIDGVKALMEMVMAKQGQSVVVMVGAWYDNQCYAGDTIF